MENSQFKILLVDDEPDVLEFLSYNLKKEGYHVLKARNGREGLLLARSENPQLVILDVMMPEMDGIETCREIRLLPGFSDTIVVFLTARGEDYSQIAGFEAGADDYITKPIKPKVLTSRVKALLRRYRSKKSHDQPVNLPDLIIDREKYVVKKDGKEISLQ
jgi:two-component system alkaline phosphatase synthesis response regulator PhoP